MRRIAAPVIAAALALASLLAMPTSAFAVVTPRIAVVSSAISEGTLNLSGSPIGGQALRVGPHVLPWLQAEFGAANVTQIGDTELADVSELQKYDVVVLARQITMTYAQRTAVREYVSGGGGIVSMFGTARWDYTAGRAPAYYPNIKIYPHLAWEWGEISELFGVQFYNDPLTASGYHVVGYAPGSHPILQAVAADLGRAAPLDMAPNRADYNEYVTVLPGASVTPLLAYSSASCNGIPTNGSGWLAGWASTYKLGRAVVFGFQLPDVAGVFANASADSNAQARSLMFESIRWAGSAKTFGGATHTPVLTAAASYSSGAFRVTQSVANGGSAQLRGQFGVTVYDPSGNVRYSRTSSAWTMLSPRTSAKGPAWAYSVRSPRGRWTVRTTFRYYDFFQGGWNIAYRDAVLNGTSAGVRLVALGASVAHAGALPGAGTAIQGADRYAVAAGISQTGWPGGAGSSDAIVLAVGTKSTDALAAAPLAGSLEAPLLLSPPGGLSPFIRAEITRLFAGKSRAVVYVASGSAWLAPGVADDAAAAARSVMAPGATVEIRRVGTNDDYATAAAIATAVGTPKTGPFTDTVVIANAGAWADALSISPLAAKHGVPILFVTATSAPAATQNALRSLGVKHCLLVGGPGTITPGLEAWLESSGYRVAGMPDNAMDTPDTRMSGATRYDVSANALAYGESFGGMDTSGVGVTSGLKWPDALSAGPMMGRAGHPVLLVNGLDAALSPVGCQALAARRGSVSELMFFGGWATVSDYVRGQVSAALGL